MVVLECGACGRLVVANVRSHYATPLLVTALTSDSHVGARWPDDASSWPARCEGRIYAVKPWPELRAAFRLGGTEAAELLVRPPERRHLGLIK